MVMVAMVMRVEQQEVIIVLCAQCIFMGRIFQAQDVDLPDLMQSIRVLQLGVLVIVFVMGQNISQFKNLELLNVLVANLRP